MDWMQTAFNYGLPTVLLFAAGIGIWRASIAVSGWLAPRADKVISAHIEALGTMSSTQQEIKSLIIKMDRGEQIDAIHENVGQLVNRGCGRQCPPLPIVTREA